METIKRKVIQIANSTQLISLPRKWSIKYGIKKGDELEIEEQGNKILIATENVQESGSIEIEVTDMDRDSLMYLIRSLYIRGYDEIKINFSKQTTYNHRTGKEEKVISIIHEEVNRLSGVEVIQHKENYCLIKDIAQGSIKEFDVVLRRIFLLLVDGSSDLLKGSSRGDLYLVDSLQEKHNTITKFIANNLRLLNKVGYPKNKDTALLYYIIASLDNITDILKECARDIVALKIKFSKETENILKIVNDSLRDYHEFFYKFDIIFLKTITSRRYTMLKDISKFSKKINPNELRLMVNMWHIVEQILDLSIARVGLEY